MLSRSDGILINKSLAAHYLKMSADQDNAEAQYTCGVMLDWVMVIRWTTPLLLYIVNCPPIKAILLLNSIMV
jgi:hypothetical protein